MDDLYIGFGKGVITPPDSYILANHPVRGGGGREGDNSSE